MNQCTIIGGKDREVLSSNHKGTIGICKGRRGKKEQKRIYREREILRTIFGRWHV